MGPPDDRPPAPSLTWRTGSSIVIGTTGLICRTFLLGASHLETHGLEGFLRLLDKRKDPEARERGLITVSNHVSVIDDPAIWGALPFRYHWNPDNLRWSLASHDLAFPNKVVSTFFSLGNTLPCHRLAHSKYGGLFQPTMTETIRLLSRGPFQMPSSLQPDTPAHPSSPSANTHDHDISDPFTHAALTYTTTGTDRFPIPSAYQSRRLGWVHIFPEGKIHQHPERVMRYFKWGVARLILESDPMPDVVPIWIEGPDRFMHESRTFPRFLPRPGKNVSITFGDPVDTEAVFGDLRRRWQSLCESEAKKGEALDVGMCPKALMYTDEAVRLRKECTMRVRDQVLKLRSQRGYSDEDPKFGKVETWIEEGGQNRQGQLDDGSWVKEE